MNEMLPPGESIGDVTYYINTNPSNLNFNRSNNDSEVKLVSVNTQQSGLENFSPEYKIEFLCATNQYGYDVFEIDGDTFIENSNSAHWAGNVKVKISYLSNVPNGYYTGYLYIIISYKRDNEPWAITASKQVNLSLSVNLPTSYNFSIDKAEDFVHYTRGNNNSTNSIVNVVTDTDYVINGPSYVLVNGEALPKNFPAGNRQLKFTAQASNQLEYGNNVASVIFRKVNQTLTTFILNVLQTNTNNLEVSKENFSFSHLQSIGFSDWQYFNVYQPNAVTIIKPDWIELRIEREIGNIKEYAIRSISNSTIEVGEYQGQLIFNDINTQIAVNLKFELYSYWNTKFDKEIHFTKEHEALDFYAYQRNSNNYLKLELKGNVSDSLNDNFSIDTIQNIYYFNNKGKFDLGAYLHRYFDLFQNQINYFDFLNFPNGVHKQYELGKIDITVSEYNYETEEIAYSYTIPSQLYLKGHRPKTLNKNNTGVISNATNKICRATPQSKIIAHFLTKQLNSKIYIYVNQVEVTSYNANELNSLSLYSLYYDLKELDLQPGNLVDVVYGNQAMQYQILPSTAYSNHIIYIDYWGLPQIFEMTGGYSYVPKEEYSTFRNPKNHQKNVGVNEEIILKWNTGYYFRNDIPKIKEIAQSKVCWLVKNNQIIEIVPIFQDFDMFSTDNYLYSSELEFYINAEDYDTCFTD
ncbi:hypothetical protein [Faecalibacter sp. LW9]|uniref:hypothetical protein n=1 Tax=Faecalibacter sp. LW9 TaxID=3103144 RepID=UPI002AFE0568|nr:hypothetical protein [Faecalibacter sp. LW9]